MSQRFLNLENVQSQHILRLIYSMQQNPIPPAYQLPVPISIHKDHREKLLSALRSAAGDQAQGGIILFEGVPTIPVDDQDTCYLPQQECNFWYLFGVQEPDCYGLIEIDTGRTVLFVPNHPESYKLWMAVKDKNDFLSQYQVDEVNYVEDVDSYLKSKSPRTIFLFDGVNPDSGKRPKLPTFPSMSDFQVDKETLFDILSECRVSKSEEELKILRFVIKNSSDAHVEVLRKIRSGNTEFQIEALFKYQCQSTCGARFQAYNCICGSGRNAATLHYEVNSELIKENSLALCDMGSKYYGYCADITVTFPVSGKFDEKQKVVYNAVLAAQQEVYRLVKPGVNWGDCHLAAERTILTHLHTAGLIVGDLEEAINQRIGVIFFPHGLGHLLGLAVHDLGGYTKNSPPRSQLPGLNKLRTRRDLIPGMVLTNEPGCYFVEFALNQAYNNPEKAKFLNKELLDQYLEVGGVRLEDNFVVTETGYEILSDVPRTVEQVEACMRGEDWKKVASS